MVLFQCFNFRHVCFLCANSILLPRLCHPLQCQLPVLCRIALRRGLAERGHVVFVKRTFDNGADPQCLKGSKRPNSVSMVLYVYCIMQAFLMRPATNLICDLHYCSFFVCNVRIPLPHHAPSQVSTE